MSSVLPEGQVLRGWVHGRTILTSHEPPRELNGCYVRLQAELETLGPTGAPGRGMEAQAQQTLERVLSPRRGPFCMLRSRTGRVVSEPGFKNGRFLGAGRTFFTREMRRLRIASLDAEEVGLDGEYVEHLEAQIRSLRDLLDGATFPDAFVQDLKGERWLALELKVLREGRGIRELLTAGTAASDWADGEGATFPDQFVRRAHALPETFPADDPSSDSEEEFELRVEQALVLDVRCLPGVEAIGALALPENIKQAVVEEIRSYMRPGSVAEALRGQFKEIYFLSGPKGAERLSESSPL